MYMVLLEADDLSKCRRCLPGWALVAHGGKPCCIWSQIRGRSQRGHSILTKTAVAHEFLEIPTNIEFTLSLQRC